MEPGREPSPLGRRGIRRLARSSKVVLPGAELAAVAGAGSRAAGPVAGDAGRARALKEKRPKTVNTSNPATSVKVTHSFSNSRIETQ